MEIRKAAVLGAGTMGSRIAAHLANAGVDCLLLDMPTPGADSAQARNSIVQNAFKGLAKSRPPAYFSASTPGHIRVGNFQDDLERIGDADWIVEAIIEKTEPKQELLRKVDKLRRPDSIVTTNTSGLPVAKLAEGLSEDFRKHWLGTHFFNPPRHMRLMELISTPDTLPGVADFVEDFCDRRLGKVVVRAKDRPNFIGNRIFLFAMMHTVKVMQEHGLTIEEVDALTGPLIGRPRMATYRLADFTGLDICVYVATNLYELVPEDEKRDVYTAPDFMHQMLAKKMLGDKSGQGFYRRDKKAPGGRLVLDLETLDYREAKSPHWDSVAAASRFPEVTDRIGAMIQADDSAGKFLWETLSELFLYAAARIPEVCDDIGSLDTCLTSGFNWERGIFDIWNRLGVEATAKRMAADGKALPPLVERALESSSKSFYGEADGSRTQFDVASGEHVKVAEKLGVLRLETIRKSGGPVLSNPGASLWDMGDGVALLEFHSKANSLNEDVFAMMSDGLAETEKNFDALVIGNEGSFFSSGANLAMLLELAKSGKWDEMDATMACIQGLICAPRTCSKPVVAAVFGQTLAGGCEVAIRCDRIQAAGETYMGLVEVGVGLIPGGGGCVEMLRRHTAGLDEKDDITTATRDVFEMIGTAKVSSSATEAREWRYLQGSDGITMNRDRLLAEAKNRARGLATAGYEPPRPSEILVGGRGVKAALDLGLWMMRQAQYISDYDVEIGKRLGTVLAGGDLTQPSFVSEDYLIGLEREVFLSLAGEQKTQERIGHFLKTRRPLRN